MNGRLRVPMADSPPTSADRAAHLEHNVDSVREVQKREQRQRPASHRVVDRISRIIARPLYLGGLFTFVASWIALNLMAPRLGRAAFDPAPFPILDGILSLAALVSTTIILIAQNRQTRIETRHAHIALQVNLMTEQKVAKIINLLEELRRDMPMVKDRYDPQAASLAQKTDALEVLTAIEDVGLVDDPERPDAPTDEVEPVQ
jgi:uncharacterized membrane protein